MNKKTNSLLKHCSTLFNSRFLRLNSPKQTKEKKKRKVTCLFSAFLVEFFQSADLLESAILGFSITHLVLDFLSFTFQQEKERIK